MPHPLCRCLDDVLESPHKQYFHTDGNQIVPNKQYFHTDGNQIVKKLNELLKRC